MFDSDAYIAALEPPALKYEGRVYVGRTLSIHEWIPMEEPLRRCQSGEGTLHDAYTVISEFCRIAFRRPWWCFDWLRFWRTPVHKIVFKLPPVVLMELTRDFLASQAAAIGIVAAGERDDDGKIRDSLPVTLSEGLSDSTDPVSFTEAPGPLPTE